MMQEFIDGFSIQTFSGKGDNKSNLGDSKVILAKEHRDLNYAQRAMLELRIAETLFPGHFPKALASETVFPPITRNNFRQRIMAKVRRFFDLPEHFVYGDLAVLELPGHKNYTGESDGVKNNTVYNRIRQTAHQQLHRLQGLGESARSLSLSAGLFGILTPDPMDWKNYCIVEGKVVAAGVRAIDIEVTSEVLKGSSIPRQQEAASLVDQLSKLGPNPDLQQEYALRRIR